MRLPPETRIEKARRLYKLHVRGWLIESCVAAGIVVAIVGLDRGWRWLVRSESGWGSGLAASAGRGILGTACVFLGLYGMKISVADHRIRGAVKSVAVLVGGLVLVLKAFGHW